MTLPTLLPVRDLPLSVTDTQIARALGAYTAEEAAALERIRLAKYFLVRNDAATSGERWRCGRCGAKHAHLTTFCVPLPYRGLQGALYKYVQVSSDPLYRSRLSRALPDLADRHPYTAHAMQPSTPGEDFYALALGVAEPISAVYALQLCRAILGKRGRLPYPIEEVEQDAHVSRSGRHV